MSTQYEDKRFRCIWNVDGQPCNVEFIWSKKDQEFYHKQGFTPPKYCRPHREERKKQQQGPFGEALRERRRQAHSHEA